MQDLVSRLLRLKRHSLLLRAARIGQGKFRRNRHLRCILNLEKTPTNAAALALLLDLEHAIHHASKTDDPGYSFARHLEILVALLAEAELFLARPPHQKGGPPAGKPPQNSNRVVHEILT